jgi:hypothetical protein
MERLTELRRKGFKLGLWQVAELFLDPAQFGNDHGRRALERCRHAAWSRTGATTVTRPQSVAPLDQPQGYRAIQNRIANEDKSTDRRHGFCSS